MVLERLRQCEFVGHKTTRVEAGKQLAFDATPHMNRDCGFKEISGALHAAKLASRESNCVRDVLTLSCSHHVTSTLQGGDSGIGLCTELDEEKWLP